MTVSTLASPNVGWQTNYLQLMPEIDQRLRFAFRGLGGEAKEDAVAEAVLHTVIAYFRLYQTGQSNVATASTLAFYAAKQTRSGRPAVGGANRNDPLSRLGQVSHNIKPHGTDSGWVDAIVDDKHASVPDIVATRVDFRDWLETLSRRMREIAADLALGHATAHLAKKHNLSSGRISQYRRALYNSWSCFQGEALCH
jgi:hypothetical protein